MGRVFISTGTWKDGRTRTKTHMVGGGDLSAEDIAAMIEGYDMYPGAEKVELRESELPGPATLGAMLKLKGASPDDAAKGRLTRPPAKPRTPKVSIAEPIKREVSERKETGEPSNEPTSAMRRPASTPVVEYGGPAPNVGKFVVDKSQPQSQETGVQQPSGQVK